MSACGGIFDRLGWLLQHILKPLVKNVAAHIKSTVDLISRFNAIDKDALRGKIPVSFDVVSLYTNINTEEAINTTLEYMVKYEIHKYGLLTEDVWELLHLLLDNNVLSYADLGYYQQIRGLAMGNRLSGTLAILCLDRFECLYIYRELHPKPVVYVRFVDDVGTTVNGMRTDEAEVMLKYLN